MRSNGFTDLVLIFMFMLGGIPLMIALATTCNSSKMSYLNDKSVYNLSTSVDYFWDRDTNNDGVINQQDGPATLVHVNLAPLKLSYGESLVTIIIQDDLCPDGNGDGPGDVMNIVWDFNMTKLGGASVASEDTSGPDKAFMKRITKGWNAKKYDVYDSAKTMLLTHINTAKNGNGNLYSIRSDTEYPYYLVYDYANDAWTVTREFINVFEVN